MDGKRPGNKFPIFTVERLQGEGWYDFLNFYPVIDSNYRVL